MGTEIAQNTADVLLEVVNSIQSVVQSIDQIAIVSNEQSESVEQVSKGINQISDVVQSNSDWSEGFGGAVYACFKIMVIRQELYYITEKVLRIEITMGTHIPQGWNKNSSGGFFIALRRKLIVE